MIFGAFWSSIFVFSDSDDFGYKSYVDFLKSDVDLWNIWYNLKIFKCLFLSAPLTDFDNFRCILKLWFHSLRLLSFWVQILCGFSKIWCGSLKYLHKSQTHGSQRSLDETICKDSKHPHQILENPHKVCTQNEHTLKTWN